jgi:hypothetical protein
MTFPSIFGLVTITLLTACAGTPEQTTASTSAANAARTAPAKPQLEFIDLAGFDRELSSSLTAM